MERPAGCDRGRHDARNAGDFFAARVRLVPLRRATDPGTAPGANADRLLVDEAADAGTDITYGTDHQAATIRDRP
jgi:hypothetical protein